MTQPGKSKNDVSLESSIPAKRCFFGIDPLHAGVASPPVAPASLREGEFRARGPGRRTSRLATHDPSETR